MSDIPDFRPFKAGEGEAPEWFDRFMGPVYRQIDLMTKAFQGKVGPENLNEEIRDLEVRHQVPLEVVSSRIKSRPRGAQVIASEAQIAGLPVVEVLDVGKLRITVSFAAPVPAGDVPIVVKIFGG